MMSETQSNPPMYFTSLKLENIKCFGQGPHELKLTKPDGTIAPWTIILGDNGVGKTTLLKCLAWMVPVESPPEEKNNGTDGNSTPEGLDVKPSLDDFDDEIEYERLVKAGEIVKAKIEATWCNGIHLREKYALSNQLTIGMRFERKNRKLDVIDSVPHRLPEFVPTTLFAYGAHRHTTTERNADSGKLENPISNLISEGGELYNAEELLSNYHTLSLHRGGTGKAATRLKKIKKIIRDLLPVQLNGDSSIRINPPINEDGSAQPSLVDLKIEGDWVPLSQLSLGYQTMFALMVDLVVRMFKQYPESKRPLSEAAVVLIDEIDLHLHPQWQRDIRRKLSDHFPNTQFICTAHSPFMAQDAEEENIVVIKRVDGEVQILNNPIDIEGWRIDQIVTSDLFGLANSRSKEVEEKAKRRRELLEKGRENLSAEETVELKSLGEELDTYPSNPNPENQKLLDTLKEAAKLLREKGVIRD
jgi:predicted ATP-binding protein involved in virulence